MNEISNYYARVVKRHGNVLDRATETALAQRAAAGDREAKAQLVAANLRLVILLAKPFRRSHLDFEDLIQEGNIGLLRAIERFDPSRGTRLGTYAVWWIRAALHHYTGTVGPATQIGYSTRMQREIFYRGAKLSQRIEARGEIAGPAAVATELGVAEREASLYLAAWRPPLSFDTPVPWRPDGYTLAETLPATNESAEARVATNQAHKRLHIVLRGLRLDLREREILRLRLLSPTPLTCAEIGRTWNVSRERVRQIEERLINKIRAAYEPVLEVEEAVATAA